MSARALVASAVAVLVGTVFPMSSMGAPASPVEVRAAYSSAAGSEVVLFAASDGGFFTRNGLDVSMTRISGLDPRTLIDDSVVIEAEKGLQGR